MNGPVSEVSAQATVTSCELVNIAVDTCLFAPRQIHQLWFGPLSTPPFSLLQKKKGGQKGKLIKRRLKRLNKGKQQCGLGKLLSGI